MQQQSDLFRLDQIVADTLERNGANNFIQAVYYELISKELYRDPNPLLSYAKREKRDLTPAEEMALTLVEQFLVKNGMSITNAAFHNECNFHAFKPTRDIETLFKKPSLIETGTFRGKVRQFIRQNRKSAPPK